MKKIQWMNRIFHVLYYIVLLVVALSGPCMAAEKVKVPAYREMRSYTIADGLLSSSVYGIVQDSLGFIWFGTDNGLSRFDGRTFRNYVHDDSMAEGSISANNIRRLMLDSNGKIWISLEDGVDIYDPSRGCFSQFDAETDDGMKVEGQTIEIIEDRDGEIWIATVNSGLFRWNPHTGRLKVYRHSPDDPSSIAENYISTLYESRDGTIWIGTYSRGLDAFSKRTGKFVHCTMTGEPGSLSDNSVDAITEDSAGYLWIGTVGSGIDRYDRKAGTFTNFNSQRLQRIHYLEETVPGELLVCSHSGAALYRMSDDSLVPVEDADSLFTRTDCRNVYTCLRDREGNWWFGSQYGGVEFHPARNSFVSYVLHPDADEDSGRGMTVSAISELSKDLYLLGTEDSGVFLFDRNDRSFRQVGSYAGIYPHVVSALIDGSVIWVSTYRRGVFRYDMKSGVMKNYLSDSSSPSSRVFFVFKSGAGSIWAGTSAGFYRYDGGSDSFVEQLPLSRLSSMAEDGNGMLWIATSGNGLYSYDAASGSLRHYLHDSDDPGSVCSNAVSTVAVDGAGRLWAGSNGSGVCRYDLSSDAFVRYDGPEFKFVKQIFPDGDRLWMLTNRGVSLFYPDRGHVRSYLHTAGVRSDQFRNSVGIRTSDGRIVFAEKDGICVFTPPHVSGGGIPAYPPVITQFSIGGSPVFPSAMQGGKDSPLSVPIEQTRQLTLRRTRASLEFRFVSPTYLSPESCFYRYRLDGSDNAWKETDSRVPAAYYSNLPAGNYSLRIQASNDGVNWENAPVTELCISVLPPLLLSRGALGVYCILFVLLASAGVCALRRFHKKRAKEKSDLEKSETERDFYQQQAAFYTNVTGELRALSNDRRDEEFLAKCREIVLSHLNDPGLSVDLMVRELGMSRASVFRKLKTVVDMTPNDFMKQIRLKEAARLMVEGKYSITEIGYLTGFSSPSYFAKCFAKEFDILPTEFISKIRQDTESVHSSPGEEEPDTHSRKNARRS